MKMTTTTIGIGAKHISQIRDFLISYLNRKSDELAEDNSVVRDALGRLADYTTRGKMVRAGLVPLACEMAGGPVTPGVLEVAGGIELFHSSLLIQDDIIDQDDVRRGLPAMHAQYQRLASSRIDAPSARLFGQSMSLCLSSVSLVSAFEVLVLAGIDDRLKAQTATLWSEELVRVGFAEMEEMQLAMLEDDAPVYRIWSIYKGKTAGYSFTLPLLTGLILGGADPGFQASIQPIGELLGLMFQIRDDHLGLFGDATVLGKPVGSDVVERKKTMIYSYLLTETPKEVGARIRTIYSNPGVTEEDVEYVRRAAVEHGIDSRVVELIQELRQELERKVEELATPEFYKDSIRDLAGYVVSRTK